MPHIKVMKACLLFSSLLISGCQAPNPYTGQQEYNKTTQYSAFGALSGAVVGAIANGGNGALAGALIGGLGGAATGQYQDRQEQALRQKLKSSGVSVTRDGNQITLIFPSRLTFATNSSDIQSSLYRTLSGVAEILKEFDNNKVIVVGYTDNTGKFEYNKELSLLRAGSVADYLATAGVSPKRLNAIGQGPKNPVDSNDTEEGRQQNRRVEIYLQPAQST